MQQLISLYLFIAVIICVLHTAILIADFVSDVQYILIKVKRLLDDMNCGWFWNGLQLFQIKNYEKLLINAYINTFLTIAKQCIYLTPLL